MQHKKHVPGDDKAVQSQEQRGLGHDLAVTAVATGTSAVLGAATHQVVGHLLNRPPKQEPQHVVLPPGVSDPKK